MNKKLIVGLMVGAVLATGFGIWAADLGGPVTIQHVENFNYAGSVDMQNVETDSSSQTQSDMPLGGTTNFDRMELSWLKTGELNPRVNGRASTTDAQWNAHPILKSLASSGDDEDFWKNNTGGNVWVSVDYVNFFGTASSGMFYVVATSSVPTLTDYTYTAGSVSAIMSQNDALVHIFTATSTKDHALRSTTTPMLVRPNESVVLKVINRNRVCVGGANTLVIGNAGKCEAATSTTRGFDIDAGLNVFATSTPVSVF